MAGKLSWRAGRDREALPEGPGVVGRLILEDREGSGGCPGGPEGVWRPSRWAEKGQEFLPEGLEGSISLPKGPSGVGKSYQRVGRGWDVLPEVWEGSEGPA